ncbi:SDR family NAD(P)-dependent oxidoreductase [Kribbella sp. NPDC050124]|uniref:SDR family NAD(P)-dependent oxidoreductase n=1 Tax=Kribbella sp. NPDC050124 TaxID=3364114 RepID=UPI00379AA617
MTEIRSVGQALASAVRARSAEAVAALLAARAVVDLGGDETTVESALHRLSTAQRCGVTLLGDEHRSVVVVPAELGLPSSRFAFVATHPDSGPIVELLGYPDLNHESATDAGYAPPVAGVPLPAVCVDEVPVADERVLVTASSGGLGQAIAGGFLEAGAAVVIHGRRTVADAATGSAGYVAADLTRAGEAERLAIEAAELLGAPITVLVHALGPWDPTPAAGARGAARQASFDANVSSALDLCGFVAPGMRQAGRGRIMLVSAGSAWIRDHGLYGLSKAMLAPLVQTLAVELAPEITVNAVAPGQIRESVATMEALHPGAGTRTLRATPTGRFVTRGEVAQAVLALTRAPFDSLNGAVIPLDGGARLPVDRRVPS